jgi:hypothetical protein
MKKRPFVLAFTAVVLGGTFLLPPVRSAVDDSYREIKLVVDVLQRIREQYVVDVDQKSLVYGAAAGGFSFAAIARSLTRQRFTVRLHTAKRNRLRHQALAKLS